MTLAAGARLGPYEIVSPLGAGGMGEVYRARDTRLDRTVAVKVLPDALSDDPQFRERFDREARAISQLAHPHICTLHDVGQEGTTHFLVLEHLEGETLDARLKASRSSSQSERDGFSRASALPLDEAMAIAVDVADALVAAHRAGVVHRDLKPANIFLVRKARSSERPVAKLLDFGLAKTAAPVIATSGLSMLPTTPPAAPHGGPLTAQGTILGTFQYMAPEQIEGLEADARTDIFAFGAVMYEMLTGRKAFEGKTRASLLGAILKDDPRPIVDLQPLAPAALDRVVRTCLEKDPDDRWQTARDLLRELQWSSTSEAVSDSAKPPATVRSRSLILERLVWAGALILTIAGAVAGTRLWRSTSSRPPMRFSMSAPPDVSLALEGPPAIAISPDGTLIAFRGSVPSGVPQLFLRRADQFEATPIRGTESAIDPFFSPDSQWLAFFAEGKLKKVPIAGGPPSTICEAPGTANSRGGTWGSNDTIVFPAQTQSGLVRVPAGGGIPSIVTTLDTARGERSHRWPQFLPGGRAVLFVIQEASISYDDAVIAVKALDTGEQRTVVTGGTRPRFASTGHVLFQRGTTLFAVPFDANTLRSSGSPVPLVENVLWNPGTGLAHYDIAATGTLIYAGGSQAVLDRTLAWVDRHGTAREIPGLKGSIIDLALSPDARRLALSMGVGGPTGSGDVWIYEFDRGALTRLTFGERGLLSSNVTWTPDGQRVVYSWLRNNEYQIFSKPSDFSGTEEQLFKGDATGHFSRSFSPDGRWLLYQRGFNASTNDLWVLPLDGDKKPRPFVATPANETQARFSPDGRWVAYQSNETGREEIYVQPFPGPSGKRQISIAGGTRPTWAPNGRELFYRNGEQMIAVALTLAPVFSAGTPQMLFQGQYESQYDVARDGRFLMLKSEQQARQTSLNVVGDWFTELSARVPRK